MCWQYSFLFLLLCGGGHWSASASSSGCGSDRGDKPGSFLSEAAMHGEEGQLAWLGSSKQAGSIRVSRCAPATLKLPTFRFYEQGSKVASILRTDNPSCLIGIRPATPLVCIYASLYTSGPLTTIRDSETVDRDLSIHKQGTPDL